VKKRYRAGRQKKKRQDLSKPRGGKRGTGATLDVSNKRKYQWVMFPGRLKSDIVDARSGKKLTKNGHQRIGMGGFTSIKHQNCVIWWGGDRKATADPQKCRNGEVHVGGGIGAGDT